MYFIRFFSVDLSLPFQALSVVHIAAPFIKNKSFDVRELSPHRFLLYIIRRSNIEIYSKKKIHSKKDDLE
jgi:hypothetical protein